MGQLNIRTPKSTESQIDFLIEETGMTQTQIVIQAIDRLTQAYKAEKEKTVNNWTAEKTAWASHRLDHVTDVMSERDMPISPKTLSEFFQQEEGLSLTEQEAAGWLATQDWYKDDK